MTPYVPLWCKSNYSFLEGASHPEELIRAAVTAGLPALALTDRNGVYGSVRAHEEAKAAGLKLILGAQVSCDPSSDLVLLAEDREGWATLCALLTQGHRDQPKGAFVLGWEQIAHRPQGLTALWRPTVPGLPRDKELGILSEAFPGRFYGLMSRHRSLSDPVLEREMKAHCGRYDLVPLAASEVLYHTPDRQELQDAVTCIRHGVRLADAGTRLKPNAEHALKTDEAFRDLYRDEPGWVNRTAEVAERCQFSLSELEYRYPVEGVAEGYTTESWLREKVTEGAGLRYGNQVPQNVRQQVEKELSLITELRYSGYFLTMWEIVQYCHRQGILCQGRGSAANSAVCYCLGITAVDPVEMNLLFERFLSKERAEPPDIDLDIEHRRREEVIQHMYASYGRHRAAMVANVVRYRGRSALREVGKVLDIPAVDQDRYAKLLVHSDSNAPWDEAGSAPQAVYHRWGRLAEALEGFPRHLSIHPGGFLLGSEPLDRIVPVESASMEGRTVIQWDKTDVEAMSLFKVDLLGLGALTHLDYAFRLLKDHRGIEHSMASLPPDDKPVYDMICRADTLGVFQIESRAQMSMLPRLKPRRYYDLVIEVSLVRPGPISGGMVHPYLRRRNGEEPVTYPHPLLEPVLEKTLGIPLFQEQVMKLAVVAADYTPGEADQLRRDMAAWKSTGRIEEHREKLIRRMVAKGIEAEFAERVFNQIKGFGEYGFPESHAASFALVAYATAWFKCHHPDVFACALLNAWPMGFYAPATILADAKRHGVALLPVDLQFSGWECTLEPVAGKQKLGLRVGLRYVRGLARLDADRMVAVRRPGIGLKEWKRLSRAGGGAWEKLAVSGALSGFGLHRREALWAVLDQSGDPLGWEDPAPPEFVPPGMGQSVLWDYQATGLSTRAHILEQFRPQLRQQGYAAAVEVGASASVQPLRYAGVVIVRQRPQTAKGVLFLTMEDETGLVNVVVWKGVWEAFRRTILTSDLLGVSGRIQEESGVVHLVADRFWALEGFLRPGELPAASHDFC
jgi:error-prone DNA polymerase